MRTAVCAIIEKDDNLLVISRRDALQDLNLPGGKVDAGEVLYTALIREVLEETGLVVLDYFRVYTNVCRGGTEDFLTTTYRITAYTGEIVSSAEGVVSWGTWEDILTDDSSFAEYNRKLYHAYHEGP